jgi:hypothetical protein
VQLTDSERKELAEMGAKLSRKALAEIATVATPDTILAWHRQFAARKGDTTRPPQCAGLRVCLKAYGMLLIPLWASKRLANVQRWILGVIESGLTRLFGCGDRVQCPRLVAFDAHNHREDPPKVAGR